MQLTGDEAYQWLWSKHLALSYYSSRQSSLMRNSSARRYLAILCLASVSFTVSGALLSLLLLRFFAREFNARAGLFLVLILTATHWYPLEPS